MNSIPADPRIEMLLLSAALHNPMLASTVTPALHPRDFYLASHQAIWTVLQGDVTRRAPGDLAVVAHALDTAGQLTTSGGMDYLINLSQLAPPAETLDYYAQLLTDAARARALVLAGQEISEIGYKATLDLAGACAEAERVLFSVTHLDALSSTGMQRENAILRDYYTALAARQTETPTMLGLATGLTDLDRLTDGLQPGDLDILAARPSMGKSSLALTIAYNVACNGHGVGIFSMEMTKQQLGGSRLMSIHTGIPTTVTRNGLFTPDQWDCVGRAFADNELSGLDLWIDDRRGVTPDLLASRARRLANETDLKLLVLDYIGLMRVPGMRATDQNAVITEITYALTTLAGDLHIPILALSQLNRAVESRAVRIPQLSDIRDSGSVEQDAALVAFLYRDEYYNPTSARPGQADLIVAKHRNGATGVIPLRFDGPTTHFTDWEG